MADFADRDTPNGHVEVHVASQASNYQTRIFEEATIFASEDDGTWMVGDFTGTGRPDLISIKTSNTRSNTVEVHVASASSNYQSIVYSGKSAFGPENNGVWTMADATGNNKLDLVYVKTRSTGTGNIEVHIASATSDYEARIVDPGTVFKEYLAPDICTLCWQFTTPTNRSHQNSQYTRGPCRSRDFFWIQKLRGLTISESYDLC
ncbi:hypothetical protein V8E54_007816 [Elaphomyces granulatus]